MKYDMILIGKYDIQNEKRLRRIAKIMERYGVRVQKLVFETVSDERTIVKVDIC